MVTIRLLQFNNYYNRKVKKFNSIEDYDVHVCINDRGTEATFPGITNFIVRDGVDTTYVANWDGETPDYLLVTDSRDQRIISRWFVIEANFVAFGQHVLTLHRDLIADFYDDVVKAPTYIEKAALRVNDPFIFNSENIEFNQIKSSETLIEDDLSPRDVAWLCGYVAADAQIADIDIPDIGQVDIIGDQNIPLKKYLDKPLFNMHSQLDYGYKCNLEFIIKLDNQSTVKAQFEVRFCASQRSVQSKRYIKELTYSSSISRFEIHYPNIINATEWFDNSINIIRDILNTYVKIDGNLRGEETQAFWNSVSSNRKFISNVENADMQNQDNKIVSIVKDGKTTYHTLNYDAVAEYTPLTYNVPVNSSLYNQFVDKIKTIPHDINYPIQANAKVDIWNIPYNWGSSTAVIPKLKKYYLTDRTVDVVKKVDLSNRGHLTDQPFDMLIIPYAVNGSVDIKTDVSTISCSREVAVTTAMEIVRTQGAKIYDMQLLPYCPMREIFSKDSAGNNIIDISKYMSRASIIYDSDGTTKKGVVLYPTVSRSSFTIGFDGYRIENENAIEKKVKILTKMHRLCSPGYNSIFEFNAEKNGGIPGFNVTCDFKPISPFIHIAPVFGGLYGRDYKDMRGLTCSEDFSITRIESAFVDFELRNKNYQNIFNREIQNMEDTHRIHRWKSIFDTTFGSISGGIAAGTAKAGGLGAGIGYGVKNAIAGTAGIVTGEYLHLNDLDVKKDMYGYNLENISAIPNTIAKISAFCQNNKIFPVLEEYSATEVEEQALRDKLKYNGMSVHRIGQISDFIQEGNRQFIQGHIIRMENLVEDYHLSYSIALEINNGVFI